MARVWMVLAAAAGCTAVMMAALASHALPARLDARAVAAVRAAVQMQGWHALALALCALWLARGGPWLVNLAAGAFAAGMLLFCGSVYAGEILSIRVGPTAPIGGTLLMAGWIAMAVAALQGR